MTAKNSANSRRPSVLSCSRSSIALLVCALSMLALSSCAIGTKPTLAPPPSPPPPSLQANLRQPCPALPPARSSLLFDLSENHDVVTGLYHDCKSNNAHLIQASDEWQATAWQWYCTAVKRIGIDAAGCPRK